MAEKITNQKTLKIKIGEEYKAKIENIGEFKDSMFKDIYDKSFNCVDSILKSKTEKEYEKYNNIISFVGERGTGKTSAMLSVSNALKDGKYVDFLGEDKEYKDRKYINKVYDELKEDNNFFDIGIIDPSHFDKNSNILEIILAKIFKKFKVQIEKSKNGETNHDKKRNLIKAFEEVFENLKTIQDPKDLYKGEALDALLKMSASTDLKENMMNLIEKYLEFFNEYDYKNNHILLIEIDDMDLNTKYAYEMVEQIRKYLIIPNVIILMAVKMEQLSHIVERNMRTEFEIMLEKENMNDEEPKNMAEKYLEKLIPLERRLFLEKMGKFNNQADLKIIDENNEIVEEGQINQTVMKLIYLKTDMIFIDSKYIVPINLRELIEVIVLLVKMKDVRTLEKRNIERSEIVDNDNFIKFKNYFFEIWASKHLNYIQKNTLKELYNREINEKNKFIINKLEDIYSILRKDERYKSREGLQEYSELEKEYQNIVNLNNNSENISLGDLLFVLNKINRYKIDLQDKQFIYSIKIIYSFMLYELYAKKETQIENKFNDYQKLLGGYVYNPNETKIMRDEQDGGKRDRREINIENIDKFILEFVEQEIQAEDVSIDNFKKNIEENIDEIKTNFSEYYQGKDFYDEIEEVFNTPINKEKIKVKLEDYKNDISYREKIFEKRTYDLFNMFIVKSNEFNDKSKKYRQSKEIYYKKRNLIDFKGKKIRVEFDILGFLFNDIESDFYIGNLELFEEILKTDNEKISSNTTPEFFSHFKHFFNRFKTDIPLNGIRINRKKHIKKIIKFIDKVSQESTLKEKFNEIFMKSQKDLLMENLLDTLVIEYGGRKLNEVGKGTLKGDLKEILKGDIFNKKDSIIIDTKDKITKLRNEDGIELPETRKELNKILNSIVTNEKIEVEKVIVPKNEAE